MHDGVQHVSGHDICPESHAILIALLKRIQCFVLSQSPGLVYAQLLSKKAKLMWWCLQDAENFKLVF